MIPADDEGRIEAPYLQLVMERLWREERSRGSGVLRLETLRALGGAEAIVRAHLHDALEQIEPARRSTTARMFSHLVTPSGTKIAHTVDDLARYAGAPASEVEPTLVGLAQARILRPVAAPDEAEGSRYELFHDVLAGPVLEWCAQQEAAQQVERERRRRRRLLAGLAAALALLAGVAVLAVWALVQRNEAQEQRANAAEQAALAERQAAVARVRELAALADAQLTVDPHRSLHIAIRSVEEALPIDPPLRGVTSQAVGALGRALNESRLRSVLRGHEDSVNSGFFSPDGTRVVTASDDNTARVWDAASGEELAVLEGHENFVRFAAFSPDGTQVVTASWDGTRPRLGRRERRGSSHASRA